MPDGRLQTALIFAALAIAVLAFAGGWPRGRLVLDGPGVEIYLRLALDSVKDHGTIPFWLSAFWSGSPAWALAPAVSYLGVLPFAEVFGVEQGVIVAMVVGQIVGAWGAYVFARSLWGEGPAPALAGLFYGLSPVFVSHTALFGHQPPGWVYAAMPWMAWSLRLTLRRGGTRWIAISALITSFAVLQQAEHAYGLALIALAIVVAELLGSRVTPRAPSIREVLGRAAAVVGLSLGLCAHWLLPLATLKGWFAFNPPEELRFTLGPRGIGGLLGSSPSAFLTRPSALSGRIGFFSVDLIDDGAFYLGGVLVALTFVTAVLLVRNTREGATLGAILLASTFAVWTSTALTPLADTDLSGIVPCMAVGLLAGLFVAGLFQRMNILGLGAAVLATIGLAVAVPYVAPFRVLRDFVPLLSDIRFPRMYPIAMLGLALGGAYPVHVAGRWLATRSISVRQVAPALTLALALGLATLFLVDVWPMSSYYDLEQPSTAGYRRLPRGIRDEKSSGRVAVQHYPDSRIDLALLEDGWENATGWPHPTAGKEMWRLAAASWLYPPGQRERALGLAGASVLFYDDADDSTPPATVRNPRALPLVRSYRDLVVVEDPHLATDLAVDLASRNIGVITGDAGTARKLARGNRSIEFVAGDPCARERLDGPEALVGAVARVCSRRPWLPNLSVPETVRLGTATGAVFRSPADGLRGIDVVLTVGQFPGGQFDLTLRELGDDGTTLGPVVRQVPASDIVDVTLVRFAFDPLPRSAGRTYAFTVRCSGCDPDTDPALASLESVDDDGNLVVGGRLDAERVGLFALDYGEAPRGTATDASLRYSRPGDGQWRVRADLPEKAVVVVAEGYFPSWSARIDGKPAPVLRADGAFIGVEVGRGRHTITLDYDPPSTLAIGLVVSVIVLALVVAMIVAPRRFRFT